MSKNDDELKVSGSTELLNDLVPVTGSSPRSVDSIPSPCFVDYTTKELLHPPSQETGS